MASINISPTSVVANTTGNVITVTGVGTHFTATTPAFNCSLSNSLITAINVINDTSATITLNAGVVTNGYPGTGNIGDIATGDGNPFTAITSTKPNLGAVKWGYIGDSLYAGNGGNGIDYYASIWLTEQGFTPTLTNESVNGTSSAYWIPSANNIQAAVSAMVAAGVTLVHVMIGTNDVRTPNSFSAATTAANRALIAAYCLANGIPNVIFHKQPITVPNAGSSGAQWPNDPNTIYCTQWALTAPLANGKNIFIGDAGAYDLSYIQMATWTSDGVHPTGTNWQTMASMQSQAAVTPYGYPAQGGVIIGGGVGMTGLAATGALLGRNPVVRRRRLLGR